MSRQSAYVLRRRDGLFAKGWAAALVLARRHVEEVLATRALDGVEEAVFYHGEQVAVRRRFDSRLLLAHLGRLDRLAEGAFAASGMGEGADELAGRFDEVLAVMLGAGPQGDFAEDAGQVSLVPGEADPVLPLAREVYAERFAQSQPDPAWDEWLAALRVGEAERDDEPEPTYPLHRAMAEAAWDGWQARAFGAVDAAVLGEGAEEAPPLEVKSLGKAGGIANLDCVTRVNRRAGASQVRYAVDPRDRASGVVDAKGTGDLVQRGGHVRGGDGRACGIKLVHGAAQVRLAFVQQGGGGHVFSGGHTGFQFVNPHDGILPKWRLVADPYAILR